MVEVNFRVFPGEVEESVCQAVVSVVDQRGTDKVTGRIDARLKPTAKQIDAHDAEDQPEHQADEKYVEDGGNSLNQSIYDHLHSGIFYTNRM